MSILTPEKKRYNELLIREKNGEKYMNDESIPYAERQLSAPLYAAILKELNDLLREIGRYSVDDIVNGFPEEVELPY